MPYHNATLIPAVIFASDALYRFPAGSYSPAAWDADLASYAASAGLEAVLAVPAGALAAERFILYLADVPADEAVRNLVSSGATALSASDDEALVLLSHPGGGATYAHLSVRNEGANDALVSLDGGTTWFCVGSLYTVTKDGLSLQQDVLVRNAVAGQNVSGLWAEMW